MESGRQVWNGDEDLGDGQLQKQRQEYDERYQLLEGLKNQGASVVSLRQTLPKIIDQFDEDILFIDNGFKEASEHFDKKFRQANCPEEVLKEANWEVIELQTLLQQSQELKLKCEDILPNLAQDRIGGVVRLTIRNLAENTQKYLRNLFKKKRTAATHVMVTMLSDEKRSQKPYALPVQFITCQTLKDQFVRDLNGKLKAEMKSRDMTVAG